ncbi:hypothetical protein DYH09_15085 [bacterium CPR1]|nr:hypothetical protein [bacterium CPR1]
MKRLQKMIIGALTAGLLLAWVQPVSAEPQVTGLKLGRQSSSARLKPFQAVNRLQSERGKNGLISRTSRLRLAFREKGAGGRIFREHRLAEQTGRFVNRPQSRTPMRSQSFFAGQRPNGVMANNRAERIARVNRIRSAARTRLSQRFLVQRSTAFRRSSVRRSNVQAIDALAHSRKTLSDYVAANSIGSVLIQKDPASGKTFRLQFAGAPVTKRISSTQAAVRCNFFGTDSPGGATVPVVLELGMTGNAQGWRVSGVHFVSVNGQKRPGAFAFGEEELEGQAALAAEAIDIEEKEFPTKSL